MRIALKNRFLKHNPKAVNLNESDKYKAYSAYLESMIADHQKKFSEILEQLNNMLGRHINSENGN